MGATFSGSLKLWTAFAAVLSLVFFGLFVWAVWQSFSAASVQVAIGWMGIGLAAFVAVGMIKIWFWMRMNHLVMLKEIKRLELQILHRSAATAS
jgi:hypothetical protein